MIGRFDLAKYLESVQPLGAVRVSGDERYFPCPFCGKDAKCYANVAKGVFVCFRCGEKGPAVRLVKALSNVDDAGAARIMASRSLTTQAEYSPEALKRQLGLHPRRQVAAFSGDPLPEGYRSLPSPESVVGREAMGYLLGRGVTEAQIAVHRVGFCSRGRYAGYVIVPVVMSGAIVHWVARAFAAPGGKRYLNPANGDTPLTSGQVLFNADVAFLHDRVTVVEGVFDALAEGDASVSPLGKELRPAQLDIFAAHADRLAEVVVKVDEDAYVSAMKMASALQGVGVRWVTVAQPYGDPGERRGVRRRVRYGPEAHVGAILEAATRRPR